MKNKYLAAGLNVVPGIGYLYTGRRVPFAVLLLAYWPVLVIGGIIDPNWSNVGSDVPMMAMDYILGVATILPFVVDGYLQAQEVNNEHLAQSKK